MHRKKSPSYVAGLIAFLIFSTAAFAQQLPDVQAAIKAKGHKWIAAETSVSILPENERKMRLGLIKREMTGTEDVLPLGLDPPPRGDVDWRTYVTPVRDQGSCGSCWAFATTAALESYILLKEGLPNSEDNRAEQILVSCPIPSAGSCDGGYIDSASDYIQASGLPDESFYPYTGLDTACTNAKAGWQDNTYKIASWAYVPANLTAIKNALYSYGPLVTAMDVYSDFYYYAGGVYAHSYGSYVGGHAILIVGYTDDAAFGGGGYFIVKNSWGTGWGEGGYFRIAYSQLNSPVYFGQYTIAYRQPVAAPAAPTALTASPASTSRIDLVWIDNSSNEDGFKIERCTGYGCTNFSQIAAVGSGIQAYSNTGLAGSTTYTYRVRAYNTGGNSDYSNAAEATTYTPNPPGNPSSLNAAAFSSSRIDLSWTDTSNNEDGFKIERCTGYGCTSFQQIATVGANVTSYSNTGLAANTSYTYRVRAYVSDADSAYTGAASATTLCSCTISPISKNFSAAGGSATVKVTASAGCSWAATSNAAFITIASQGSRSFSYNVSANAGALRTGTITVSGSNIKTLTHTVTQSVRGKK